VGKWKLLFGIGVALLTLTFIANRAFPKQVEWTGEYIERYENTGAVKDYQIIPDERNPDWVKDFQRYGIGAIISSLFLLSIAAVNIWGRK